MDYCAKLQTQYRWSLPWSRRCCRQCRCRQRRRCPQRRCRQPVPARGGRVGRAPLEAAVGLIFWCAARAGLTAFRCQIGPECAVSGFCFKDSSFVERPLPHPCRDETYVTVREIFCEKCEKEVIPKSGDVAWTLRFNYGIILRVRKLSHSGRARATYYTYRLHQ